MITRMANAIRSNLRATGLRARAKSVSSESTYWHDKIYVVDIDHASVRPRAASYNGITIFLRYRLRGRESL